MTMVDGSISVSPFKVMFLSLVLTCFAQGAATQSFVEKGTYQETAAEYHGNWENLQGAQLSGGAMRRTREAGSYAILRFKGSSITLISKIQPDATVAEIYLDDKLVMNLEQFAGLNVWQDQKHVLIQSGLDPNVVHTLKIVHSGKQNPYNQPAWLSIDGFIVG
jgi:hypothetical protein